MKSPTTFIKEVPPAAIRYSSYDPKGVEVPLQNCSQKNLYGRCTTNANDLKFLPETKNILQRPSAKFEDQTTRAATAVTSAPGPMNSNLARKNCKILPDEN